MDLPDGSRARLSESVQLSACSLFRQLYLRDPAELKVVSTHGRITENRSGVVLRSNRIAGAVIADAEMADEENPSTMTDQHKGRIGSSGSESDSGHGVVGHDDIHVEENPKHGRTQQACDVGEPSNEPVKKPTPP